MAALPSTTPESAAIHVVRKVPAVLPQTTCAELLHRLRHQDFAYADVAVITNEAGHVLGLLSAGTLVASPPETPVQSLMHSQVAVAALDADQERVASLAIGNVLGTVPVVDADGRLIGLVPPQASLAILRREHIEDLHRLTGILRETDAARAALEGPPLRRIRHRLPWLLVGLAGSALATLVMAQFESLLEARVAVAFFLPGIVYLADAMGTQTEAIAVRGLSLSHVRLRTLLLRELFTGFSIGAILGGTAGLAVWAVLGDADLALAICIALVAAGGIATAMGLLLPSAFQRLGLDPAYGSGPLATVAQDVLSLLVYFASVSVVLQR